MPQLNSNEAVCVSCVSFKIAPEQLQATERKEGKRHAFKCCCRRKQTKEPTPEHVNKFSKTEISDLIPAKLFKTYNSQPVEKPTGLMLALQSNKVCI